MVNFVAGISSNVIARVFWGQTAWLVDIIDPVVAIPVSYFFGEVVSKNIKVCTVNKRLRENPGVPV